MKHLLTPIILALLSVSCAAVEPPDIRGKITHISVFDQHDPVGSIMIEGEKEADTSLDKAAARITLKTRILKQDGERRVEAKFSDLKVGQKVEARFVGPVAESYPVQGTAGEIVILADAHAKPGDEPPPQVEIKEGNNVVLTGALRGGMMGIGGETTGWMLTYATREGNRNIEVDISALGGSTPKGDVRVTGKIIVRQYVERGRVLILKASQVEEIR